MSAEDVAVEALEAIARTGEAADRVLRRALRSHPELGNEGRARVSRGVHGVRCFDLRLAYLIVQVGLQPTAWLRLAAYWVDLGGEDPRALELTPGERAALSRLGEVDWPGDPTEALSVRRSLPLWIARRFMEERGAGEADALAAALNEPGPIAIRANGLMNDASQLATILRAEGMTVRAGRLAPDALRLEGRPDIRGSAPYRAGRFEVQDEGSQLVAEAARARPGDTVLDLCAGAGGKTLALAAAMRDDGLLVAADPDPDRLADLRVRLGRVPLRSIRAVQIPREADPGDLLPRKVNCALADVPCSALGTLRRGPDRRFRITEEEAAALPALQLRLLREAAARVRPGGRLVYATCTVLHAENRAVAERFLALEPGFRPASVLPRLIPDDRDGQLELLPHRHDTDGFFIAAFERARSLSASA